MIGNVILNSIYSAIGTLGFAALFGVPKKYYISCGVTGIAGWLTYMATSHFSSASIGSFFAALMVVLVSRILAVKEKCPITVFLISGIFPLVPGAGIYYTVYYLLTNQMEKAALQGMNSVKIAFAIVLGIIIVVSIPREVFGYHKSEQRMKKREKHSQSGR